MGGYRGVVKMSGEKTAKDVSLASQRNNQGTYERNSANMGPIPRNFV